MTLALKLALAPLLKLQAVRTRRRAPLLPEAAGERAGLAGEPAGVPFGVLVAGDSSAAGVGVARQELALAAQLAQALARRLGRPVRWSLHAKSGLSTRSVHALLREQAPAAADVAVVVSGVNDVLEQVPPARALGHREALADWLLAEGLARHVVFAALPPMGRFPLLPQPLRHVLGTDAARHDAALARWAATRADVSHAALPLDLSPASMAPDGFHPGAAVYRACGEALAERIAALAGAPAGGASSAGPAAPRPERRPTPETTPP